jgi:hypothetical protein
LEPNLESGRDLWSRESPQRCQHCLDKLSRCRCATQVAGADVAAGDDSADGIFDAVGGRILGQGGYLDIVVTLTAPAFVNGTSTAAFYMGQ